MPDVPPLPIESVLGQLSDRLRESTVAVLMAPPGAGKTTRVPLALLCEIWLAGRKIVMLEPRRLAARAAAHRMAVTRGEQVGQTVGYRIRMDTKVSAATRIEVVTEGVLTRLLQQDPALSEYGLVIFDEFHERSLHADLGLALCLETQRVFRPELRLLVMSATLDTDRLTTVLHEAAVVRCEGRQFPVEIRYLDGPRRGMLHETVVETIRHLMAKESGSLLVFLPGLAEIRRVEQTLHERGLPPSVLVAPLHGELPQEHQDQAIQQTPTGTRKIVLATSIAETSLTIEGIRIVVDAGFMRVPRFNPDRGLARLETIRVTLDSAEQRRGRAGRLEPGLCYRLWSEVEQKGLLPRRSPEILEADLTSLRLELAHWGIDDPYSLRWLDAPPVQTLRHGEELLIRLGALDARRRITAHGRKMVGLPLHPRLAHMVVTATPLGLGTLACQVAALLGERDLFRSHARRPSPDFRLRLDALRRESHVVEQHEIDRGALRRVQELAAMWAMSFELPASHKATAESVGLLLALAYPDRIAQRLPGSERRYRLANGQGAYFPEPDALAHEPFLAVAEVRDADQWARIVLAAPLTLDQLEQHFTDQIQEVDTIRWDATAQTVLARRQRCLGALVLTDRGLPSPDPEEVTAVLLAGLRQVGLTALSWTPDLLQWRARVNMLRKVFGPETGWPDVSESGLEASLGRWLTPLLGGLTSLAQVRRLDLRRALDQLLTWQQRQELERVAPSHLTMPTGSRIRLDYTSGDNPVLAVKLQELFGCRETPRIADGRVPIVIHFLSPAGRPVQVTQDLARFWSTSYFEVRKDLRGRYPKHLWPDDPLMTPPTRRTKSRN